MQWKGIDRWQQTDNNEHRPSVAGLRSGLLSSGDSRVRPRRSTVGTIDFLWGFSAGGRDGCPPRAAVTYSLAASCKLCGIDRFACLSDVLTRINTHPAGRIEELLSPTGNPHIRKRIRPRPGARTPQRKGSPSSHVLCRTVTKFATALLPASTVDVKGLAKLAAWESRIKSNVLKDRSPKRCFCSSLPRSASGTSLGSVDIAGLISSIVDAAISFDS